MPDFNDLIKKLKEIFQIDRADLDFGIYRILNSRGEQIEYYLTHTLPQVANEKLKENSDVQNAVYRHLLTFFSRYYEEGDFISQRRYKGDTYAIPYNGEEVLLHWANKDQYYTKSGENFANYRFKLSDEREVFFKLNQADTAKDNQKDNEAKRFFTLAKVQIDDNENAILPISQSDDGQVLTILFDYKAFPKSTKQDKILADDLATIFANEIVATNWQVLTEKSPTEKNKDRTILEKHLTDYTTKNTADYFIHKDLGGFLKRELDFYIKNEVMNLDDIDNAKTRDNIAQNLRLIQTLRAIAFDIIAFLAQLENFQKRLWEKKKFVADCHYLITLDNINEKFHAEIFSNQKQLAEWQHLYGLTEVSPPPPANPHLVVNTALFSSAFQAKLLASFDELDNQINGTIIHSDNFQALNLLQNKYQGQVKCIYIDPPYNTDASAIIYKNGYKHSSWLTLINNTLISSKNLLNKKNGVLCALIDDVEQKIFSQVIEQNYNEITGTVSIRIKPSGRPIPNGFALSHEYAIFAKTNPNYPISRLEHNDEQKARYREKDEMGLFFWEMFRKAGSNSNRENRPTMFYPFYLNLDNNRLRLPQMEYDDKKQEYIIQEKTNNNEIAIYPIKDDGTDGRWYFGLERALSIINEFQARKQDDNSYRIYYRRRPNEGVQPTSLWFDAKYSATEHGTALLKDLFGKQEIFSYPKSIYAVMDCLIVSGAKIENNTFILDYFAGSGTTAHAVINLNREDNGNRKFILVEQGEYFNTVLKPRIQKVIFAKDYKDGKPVADKDGQFGGISQIVKVLKLESYEDTLNNLVLKPKDLAGLSEQSQNDYVLNYMLDIESRESLLNVADFAKPFDYHLNITTDSAGAFVRQKIDLVETFNYLIGATVLGIDDRRDSKGYVEIECRLSHQTNDDKTLIFWRDCERLGYDDIKTLFASRNVNPKDSQYQEIYINGDHTLDTVWESADGIQHTLKIKSIEQAFLDLMFGEI